MQSFLVGFIPADATQILEIAKPQAALLSSAILPRNPEARVARLEVAGTLPPAAFFADLAARSGPFDAVAIHWDVAEPATLIALMGAAGQALAPHGTLVAGCAPGALSRADLPAVEAQLAAHGLKADQAAVRDDQAILRVVPQASPLRRMRIQHLVLRPTGGLNTVRIDQPRAFLASIPGVSTESHIGGAKPDTTRAAPYDKIMVLQRQIVGVAGAPTYRRLLDLGYLLIAEFDDHPSYWPMIGEHDHRTFRFVHAVQTSTETLAGHLRAWNPEVAVFPNQIATLPPPRTPRTDGRTTLFAGAFNRGTDWQPLIEPLNRILAASEGRVDIEVVFDEALFAALETENKRFTPGCSYGTYLQVLRRCDVALLPLGDTEFNRCKSDLKFIECAANQVACLASPVVYDASIEEGRTGLFFDSPASFEAGLRRLVEDGALRAAITGAAYDHVRRNRLLAHHFRGRHDWYRSLLARKAELDAALRERLATWG